MDNLTNFHLLTWLLLIELYLKMLFYMKASITYDNIFRTFGKRAIIITILDKQLILLEL